MENSRKNRQPRNYRYQKVDEADTPSKTEVHSLRDEIIGVLILALALFLFVIAFFPTSTGVIGRLLKAGLYPVIGKGMYFLPFFVIGMGLMWIFQRLISTYKTRIMGIGLVWLAVVILLEQYYVLHTQKWIWPPPVYGGGALGYNLVFWIKTAVGPQGLFVVWLALTAIALIFCFHITLQSMTHRVPFALKRLRHILGSEFLLNRLTPLKQKSLTIPSRVVRPTFMPEVVIQIENNEREVSEKENKENNENNENQENDSDDDDKKREQKLRDQLKQLDAAAKKAEKMEKKVETVAEESVTSGYILPPLNLLNDFKVNKQDNKLLEDEIIATTKKLEEALLSFKVEARVVSISRGPTVTRYELQPGIGVKVSKIVNLADDIALNLAASGVRIEAPVPGKSVVGIEIPNKNSKIVNMLPLVNTPEFMEAPSPLLAILGKNIEGAMVALDIAKMPHVLVAGSTGSGKSVCINAMIISLLLRRTPEEVKFIMIDPKKVELSMYEDIPHLLAPVVTDPMKAAATLKWILGEMESRYEQFAKAGVKNLEGYNSMVKELWQKYDEEKAARDKTKKYGETDEQSYEGFFIPPPMPYIVIIIDELADLMMVAGQAVETIIARLAQMARATGIHLVIATQRPSVDVITGLIKANIPSRIAFAVSSQIDSRTILDVMGAEKLLGRGDMLYKPIGSLKATRAQGVYLSEKEIQSVVHYVKTQAKPTYLMEVANINPDDFDLSKNGAASKSKSDTSDNDDMYDEAKTLVINTRVASTSFVQRKLKIGYNRAARIMDQLEEAGVVSPPEGENKTRRLLL